ncbi:YeiH family putative sulfate export transporter [Janthinobacterium sp.]|uniref:YeiH family protein n=1 Tax=Janthinobacterium sp. TaxID=1871054 RepID=UPI00293D298C|nr:YeiH family putative sulfate export transporter [Janthinobacterium sp.]
MSTLASPRPTSLPALDGALLPGLLLSGALAGAAIALGRLAWLEAHGIGALTLAILLGIGVGNSPAAARLPSCASGVACSKQTLLRLGIILYGFRLSFQDIAAVGAAGVAIDALVLSSTFGLALLLGTRVFKLGRNSAILIGAGSAICGAAAIMAAEPLVEGRDEEVAVAVSTVVVCGTLAIFLYPLLYSLNQRWQLLATTPAAFGVYIGSTVHEVAQVVAAAKAVGAQASDSAVIAKMVRVMMLAPFLMILSACLARGRTAAGPAGRLAIPWFAFVFIAAVGVNSVAGLARPLVAAIGAADNVLLAMAMAALGMSTRLAAIRRAGIRPLLLAGVLFCWLIVGGAAINSLVAGALG